MCKPTVNILLSTYNGEKYIVEQIDSILRQKGINLLLTIRDDGSKDRTYEIVSNYQRDYPDKIHLYKGDNIGFANSFYDLLKNASCCEYYGFADQDDIWDEDKIINAINKLQCNEPMLYGSNLKAFNMVDGTNYLVYPIKEKDSILSRINKYIFLSNPYGCTMVWNNMLQKELLSLNKPDALTHDVWVNLVARCLGNVYFDYDQSFINYRIHGNNTCGATPHTLRGKIVKYYNFYFRDGKSLLTSDVCSVICQQYPNKAQKIDYVLSQYSETIIKTFVAIIEILRLELPLKNKLKFALLAIFRKL